MQPNRNIPTAQLRDPQHAARTSMSDEGLESLAASVRELGIIEPLIVTPREDGTFEVIAGHRRLTVAKQLQLPTVPCRIVTDAEKAAAIKIHENVEREELSPVDEAIFYAELYEQLGEDTDAVAERVKRPRAHVERRLLLLSGDPQVRDALRSGDITVGVAEELNRIRTAEDRGYYLEYARRGGCTVRQARVWREQANTRAAIAESQAAGTGSASAPPASGPAAPEPGPTYAPMAKPYELSSSREQRPCMFCGDNHEEWRMYRKFVCSPCADRHLAPVERELAARG